MEYYPLLKNSDEVRCCNCEHAKVVKVKHCHEDRFYKKVRCAKGRWASSKKGVVSWAQIKWVVPGIRGHKRGACKDYVSMGDDLEDFLNSLPEDGHDEKLLARLEGRTC